MGASQKMGECLLQTGNFSLLPGGSDPILLLPLCDHWVFNKGPFQKNELEECKHGGDGWHFPKLCLAISCGSRASRPFNNFGTFFSLMTKTSCCGASRPVLFSYKQAGKKKKKKKRLQKLFVQLPFSPRSKCQKTFYYSFCWEMENHQKVTRLWNKTELWEVSKRIIVEISVILWLSTY